MTIDDPNLCEVAVHWDGPGSHYGVNVVHIGTSTDGNFPGPSPFDFGTLSDVLDSWADFEDSDDGLSACTSSGWTLRKLVGRILTDPPGAVVERDVGVEGGLTGDPSSPQVSVLVRLATEGPARGGQGRMYIPGFPETAVDGAGNMTGTNAAGLASSVQALFTHLFTDQQAIAVVFSRKLEAAWALRNVTVDTRVATQRRRLRR